MGDAKIPKTHARNNLSAGKGTDVIYRQCDEGGRVVVCLIGGVEESDWGIIIGASDVVNETKVNSKTTRRCS